MGVIKTTVFVAEQRSDLPQAVEQARELLFDQRGEERVSVALGNTMKPIFMGQSADAVLEQFREETAAGKKSGVKQL